MTNTRDDIIKPRNRDEAMKMVERLRFERHRDGHSERWFHDAIEGLRFFSESEIWELVESFK